MSADDAAFAQLSRQIARGAGMVLGAYKDKCVRRRIAVRMRACGVHTYADYCALLERSPEEYERLRDALTINVTRFYRNADTWSVLRRDLVPALVDAGGRDFRAWSAGCSSGEEPYTIAMTLAESMPDGNFEVHATDIDTQVLAHAHDAVYPLGAVASLSPGRQKRFFLRGTGRYEGRARVRPELAAKVSFGRLNLMDRDWPIEGRFDAIFCRNVMIYFDKPTQRRLIERFRERLKPAGLFFAGHAESLLDNGRHFRLRGQTVYVRVDGGPGA